MKNIFVSLSIILFVVFTFLNKSKQFNVNKKLLIPVFLYLLMILSLCWTKDVKSSLFGLQKALPFLVIPLTFFVLPKLSKTSRNKIFQMFSASMVLYALFYLILAILGFLNKKDTDLFFNNNLVPIDPGAIYMSVFASFALFYYIQNINKGVIEKAGMFVLIVFIFLLSSKTIITIDFFVFLYYYAFFAKIPKSTKVITIVSVSVFLFFSIFYVKEVKDRFLIEYETAFVDNTTKCILIENENQNMSIGQAWYNDKFQQNSFFPGTALRVYQARIFFELLKEQHVFFQGFGVEASQEYIKQKTKKYNLYHEYGVLNFHNQYLQTFAELGFFGFLTLCLILFQNVKEAIINKNFLHIAFAFTTLMLFLTESFFCRQRGIVFFVTLYCIFNSVSQHKKS